MSTRPDCSSAAFVCICPVYTVDSSRQRIQACALHSDPSPASGNRPRSQCKLVSTSCRPVFSIIVGVLSVDWGGQVQWAHVDIAGPAWDDKVGGATGFGAQTLALWAMGKH